MSNTNSIELEASSSQYLSITDANQTGLDLSTDFTFEAWIKMEQLPSASAEPTCIINKDRYGAYPSRAYVWLFSTTNHCFIYYFSSNTAYTSFRTTNAILDSNDVGKWVHLAVTVDISAKIIKFYKNGVSQGVTAEKTNSTTIQNSSEPFSIGIQNNSGTLKNFFNGLIDDIRVWNDIRTATEIADNYEKELTGNEANLQGYWKLNNSLLDETSNDNDLTNNNSATFSTDVPFSGASTNSSNFFQFF